MKWIDLLRMSGGNLKRRKLRTFLTVLGVVIGVASIVVMLSLGIGLQEAVTNEVTSQVGGATTIQVSGSESNSSAMVIYSDSSSEVNETENAKKHVTDDDIPLLMDLEHIQFAAPVLSIPGILLSGNYNSWAEIQGVTPEYFEMLNIPLEHGEIPPPNQQNLQLVMGNLVPTNFYNERTGTTPYYDTGELPVDVINDQIFTILDEEAYYNSSSGMDNVDPVSGSVERAKPPKKHLLSDTALVGGGPDAYSQFSFSCYADLNTLLNVMKKEFAGKPFPGQPTTAAGKPLKYIAYSYISVQVDEMENVDDTMNLLRDMGYSVTSNMEYIESMKSTFVIIQAVLGGIGAISLLVAAIGIANTMMMSIYERTKEIGVIKVLGCSLKNIKQLFLLEAAFIGLLGGIVGNLLSYLLSFLINTVVASMGDSMGIVGNISSIPPWLALLSCVFALIVGMIAGFFPALRAMRLSPLAAIRND